MLPLHRASSANTHSRALSVPNPELTTSVPGPPTLGSRQHKPGLSFSHSGLNVASAELVACPLAGDPAYDAAAPLSATRAASAQVVATPNAMRLIDALHSWTSCRY